MLQVDLQLLPLVRQVVCEEHVAASRQFVDQLLALGLGHIDADAALAAIGVFHHHVPFRIDRRGFDVDERSEEHTSELQSLMRISYAVFCLKKKKIKT